MTRLRWYVAWFSAVVAAGLLAGLVWGQVYELGRVASVAAPGTPVTWLCSAAGTLLASLAVAAVIGCRAERRQP